MTPEQKAVILDYAQELQSNDMPWELFDWGDVGCPDWRPCSIEWNPLRASALMGYKFRRKPRTITVTMPVPSDINEQVIKDSAPCFHIYFNTPQDRDTARAAIREAMGEKG